MNSTVQTTTSAVHVCVCAYQTAHTNTCTFRLFSGHAVFILFHYFFFQFPPKLLLPLLPLIQIFAVCNSDKTRCFHQHYCELSLLNGVKTTWTDFQRMEGGRTFLTGVWWSRLDWVVSPQVCVYKWTGQPAMSPSITAPGTAGNSWQTKSPSECKCDRDTAPLWI